MKRSFFFVLAFLALMVIGIFANELTHSFRKAKSKPNHKQIALLFFFDKGLTQPLVWKAFLENGEANRLFNVYLYTERECLDPWWNRKKIERQVPHSKNSHLFVWQALLQEAQKNKQNLKFVFITEDSIPLKTPKEVYETLIQNEHSSMAYETAANDSMHFAKPYGFQAHELWKNKEWVILNRNHAKIISEDKSWVMRAHLRPYGQLYYPSTYLHLKGELNPVHNRSWTYSKELASDPGALFTFEQADETALLLLAEAKECQALFAAPVAPSFPRDLLLDNFSAPKVELSQQQAEIIGRRIWQRESRGSIEGLTHWNRGEEFPSLGIGHFIWFPKACQAPFQESFPGFLAYLEAQGRLLPEWLKPSKNCPWGSREEFYNAIDSVKMGELRALLIDTIPQQTLYICSRLDGALGRMQIGLSGVEQRLLLQQYARMLKHPAGIEAMIDYMHFKGEGTAPKEQYRNHGWGLKQVLLKMGWYFKEEEAMKAFVASAKAVLEERVAASPEERNEKRWLKGWHQRLDGYSKL